MEESPTTDGRSTLTAVLARLVPPGAGPGAVEAGAVDYVLRHPEGASLIAPLGGLDRLALDQGNSRFAELAPPAQDAVLQRFASSRPEGAEWLRRLVLLALEGSFCHPKRGGNRDGAGWKFAGFGSTEARSDPSRCRAS
jgi:hypothetical protein